MSENTEDYGAQLRSALERKSELPVVYFNGFTISMGTTDTLIVLKYHDEQIALLNTSHTVAKTLVQQLGGLVANFEDKTGSTIMTTGEINEKLKQGDKDDNGK